MSFLDILYILTMLSHQYTLLTKYKQLIFSSKNDAKTIFHSSDNLLQHLLVEQKYVDNYGEVKYTKLEII